MNTLVKFEIAKLLKEKGYDKPINSFYTDTGKLWKQRKQIPTANYNAYPKNPNSKLFYKYGYSAPTIAEVVMWLYKKHNIYIHISPHGDDETFFQDCKWWFSIYKDTLYNLRGGSKITKGIEDFNSPTEAYEAAIEYTLENLI